MLMGSCFAMHIGEHLQRELNTGMADVNPFGVLYNPISIANALRLLLMAEDGREKVAQHVFLGSDGVWHSWLHTSHFSGSSHDECVAKVLERYDAAREFLRNTNLLCITFGTTRCYRYNDNDGGFVVANCHKEPQRCFFEYEPSLDSLSSLWRDVISELKAFNSDMKVCFTVSPYRYRKYGFHESQIQKAKLLLLVDGLKEETLYFPAYEIVMDELRDYRFYADDMLHVSSLAVDIIYERFKNWAFSDDLKHLCIDNLKAWKRSNHRSLTC